MAPRVAPLWVGCPQPVAEEPCGASGLFFCAYAWASRSPAGSGGAAQPAVGHPDPAVPGQGQKAP
eukprot:5603492-Alexandrium_andersonii.AAC.1